MFRLCIVQHYESWSAEVPLSIRERHPGTIYELQLRVPVKERFFPGSQLGIAWPFRLGLFPRRIPCRLASDPLRLAEFGTFQPGADFHLFDEVAVDGFADGND